MRLKLGLCRLHIIWTSFQVWFGTADFEMGYKESPSEVDAEVLGCGILTCMSIVSLSILASYLIEGREVVQSTVIDSAFCIIAAGLLMTSGGKARQR